MIVIVAAGAAITAAATYAGIAYLFGHNVFTEGWWEKPETPETTGRAQCDPKYPRRT